MKKKMLYMSHVDWNWIKQRPQFLAEGLMEYFDVSILYAYQNRNRAVLQKRDCSKLDLTAIRSIPLAGRVAPLRAINRVWQRKQFAKQIRRVQPDYLYLTYPNQVELIPQGYDGTVIYDCMDDHVAMTLESVKKRMEDQERRLFERADVILISSETLRQHHLKRYGAQYEPKLHLIRNGYSGDILDTVQSPVQPKQDFLLTYVGTIGKWFNMDYVERSVRDIPGLRYRIIGPSELELPQSDQIEFPGTVEHDRLYEAVQDADAMIMPFVLNDIVRAVDPVKLYEYINYNKNILCVEYDEVQRFEPYVFFYQDYESYLAQIRGMMEHPAVKYSQQQRLEFLEQNNWSSRVRSIVEALGE